MCVLGRGSNPWTYRVQATTADDHREVNKIVVHSHEEEEEEEEEEDVGDRGVDVIRFSISHSHAFSCL